MLVKKIQRILSQPPAQAWKKLLQYLDSLQKEALSQVLPYVEQRLAGWADALRTAPPDHWRAIQAGAALPPWWKLVRHLEIGADDTLLTPGAIAALQGIPSIDLEDGCYFTPEELFLLARLEKLGALHWHDLIHSLDEWPEDEPMTEILEAAERQLSDWPDRFRQAPEAWRAI